MGDLSLRPLIYFYKNYAQFNIIGHKIKFANSNSITLYEVGRYIATMVIFSPEIATEALHKNDLVSIWFHACEIQAHA